MKQLKYLNVILTVITFCLMSITLAVTGLIPTVTAGEKKKTDEKKYILLPLNSDGSVSVKVVNGTLDVNIDEVGGYSTYGKVPVKIKD